MFWLSIDDIVAFLTYAVMHEHFLVWNSCMFLRVCFRNKCKSRRRCSSMVWQRMTVWYLTKHCVTCTCLSVFNLTILQPTFAPSSWKMVTNIHFALLPIANTYFFGPIPIADMAIGATLIVYETCTPPIVHRHHSWCTMGYHIHTYMYTICIFCRNFQ